MRVQYIINNIYSFNQLRDNDEYRKEAYLAMGDDYPNMMPSRLKKLKADVAVGEFFITNDNGLTLFNHKAYSGGWGKGHLESGNYTINAISPPQAIIQIANANAYTLQNYGWFGAIFPTFKTNRTSLGLHPDGNIEFSSGCCVFPFKTLDDNKRCYSLLTSGLESRGKLDFTVRVIYNERT